MAPIGYAYLLEHFQLTMPKLEYEYFQGHHRSGVETISYGAAKRKVISARTKIGDSVFDHLKAAIRYQGIRLPYLFVIFEALDPVELASAINETPQSRYARTIWFLYEWLMESKLNIPDLNTGNYVRLFDDNFYFTRNSGERCSRTRVINNAIGTRDFCPTIRKTPAINNLCDFDVYESAFATMQKMGDLLNANIVDRCVNYLYTKESKTSSEIEREPPSKQRLMRFNQALKNAGIYTLNKHTLIHIQNQIVSQNAKINDYRSVEIYVGETKHFGSLVDEEVHFVGPRAEHVESLMNGLLTTHDNMMTDCEIPPLMHATAISFGFVYIHPFDDGNGRTHRYLLHDVFKQRDKRHEFIIPISATILKNEKAYEDVLNIVSTPLLLQLEYEIDPENEYRVTIYNDLHYLYRYPDLTKHVEYIYQMMNTSIELDLLNEVVYLITFDLTKKFLEQQIDIPNNSANAIVNIILANGGQVSKRKQEYVLNIIPQSCLQALEDFSKQTISKMCDLTGVDLSELKLE